MDEVTPTYTETGSRAERSAGIERRQHPRRACHYQALCRSGGRAWWPVRFVDLSVGGAGVMLSSAIETGADVTFTIHLPDGNVLIVRGQVRRVQSVDGEWLAGCEFERLLTEAEFAQLV